MALTKEEMERAISIIRKASDEQLEAINNLLEKEKINL